MGIFLPMGGVLGGRNMRPKLVPWMRLWWLQSQCYISTTCFNKIAGTAVKELTVVDALLHPCFLVRAHRQGPKSQAVKR
jgi:hypothetical protein